MNYEGMYSHNLTLTIDRNIQKTTQNILDKAVKDSNAKGIAAAIVMDISTGEILAMNSKPDFDLNNPYSIPKGFDSSAWLNMSDTKKIDYLKKNVWKNNAVQYTYEPGSTFKVITAAAVLEENILTPNTILDDSKIVIQGNSITCPKIGSHEKETLKEALANYCNPPFVRMSQSIGVNKFYSYVGKFGFYDNQKTELPEESNSQVIINPAEIDMLVNSIGHRFLITPIQLLSAYSVIGNDGKLVSPHIIKEIRTSNGTIIKDGLRPSRRAISEQTSKTLKEMLKIKVNVRPEIAYKKEYNVVGKSSIMETIKKGIYTTSFVGFAPADNPKVSCIVILETPNNETSVAPAAIEIMKKSLEYISSRF